MCIRDRAGFVEGVRNRLLDGNLQATCLAVKLLDHAGQLIARMILLPQVWNSGIAHIALRKIHIVAIAFDEASTRTDGQHMTRNAAARLVERLRGEEIASRGQRDVYKRQVVCSATGRNTVRT